MDNKLSKEREILNDLYSLVLDSPSKEESKELPEPKLLMKDREELNRSSDLSEAQIRIMFEK